MTLDGLDLCLLLVVGLTESLAATIGVEKHFSSCLRTVHSGCEVFVCRAISTSDNVGFDMRTFSILARCSPYTARRSPGGIPVSFPVVGL